MIENATLDGIITVPKLTGVRVNIKADGVDIPKYAIKGSAGFDIAVKDGGYIKPGERKVFNTGLYMEIPEGFELQIRPRSGVSLKTSIMVANSPGTIDCGYNGEIGLILYNSSDNLEYITSGSKMAQGVLSPVFQADFVEVVELSETERGSGGFGSTGE